MGAADPPPPLTDGGTPDGRPHRRATHGGPSLSHFCAPRLQWTETRADARATWAGAQSSGQPLNHI
jgi:hypothetical protein